MFKVVRAILPILLLVGILIYVDPRQLYSVFSSLELDQVLLLFFASFVLIWISCIKWRMFIRASGNESGLFYLIRLYVLGYFVNLVSPSTFGGDVVRSYQLAKSSGKTYESFSATFLERFTGLIAMAILSFCAVIFGSSETTGLELPVFLFGFIVLSGSVVCFTGWGIALFESVCLKLCSFFGDKFSSQAAKFISKIKDASSFARSDLSLIVKTLFVSFLFHFCTIWNTKLAANAIGWWSAPLDGLLVVVPLVLIVSAIPLTPGGIGLQEGAFVFLLQRIGAGREEALAVALLLRAKSIVLGILGGFIWFGLDRSSSLGSKESDESSS